MTVEERVELIQEAVHDGLSLDLAIADGIKADRLSEAAKFRRALTRQRESFERTRPLCSDHRDKMEGWACLGCLIEQLERMRQS